MYSEFEYYLNNILFVFVFGQIFVHEYYSYSYSLILKKRILFVFVFGQNSDSEYYSCSYSVQKTVFAHLCPELVFLTNIQMQETIKTPAFQDCFRGDSCFEINFFNSKKFQKYALFAILELDSCWMNMLSNLIAFA